MLMNNHPKAKCATGTLSACAVVSALAYVIVYGWFVFNNPNADAVCCANATQMVDCEAVGAVNVANNFNMFFLIMFIVSCVSLVVLTLTSLG